MLRRWLFCGLLLTACKGDGQSLRSAAAILCATDEQAGVADVHPAERQARKAAWIAARLEHREVRALFERLSELPPAERVIALRDLMARAGLTECGALAPPGLVTSVDLGDVTGAGAIPLGDHPGLVVAVTPDALLVEGQAVVALKNGVIDAVDGEGGADGLLVPRLQETLAQHRKILDAAPAAAGRGDRAAPRLLLLLPRDASVQMLLVLTYTASRAGFFHFGLAARRGEEIVAVPFQLARPRDPGRDLHASPDTSVQMAVAVPDTNLVLFSMSGLEGTIAEAKLRASWNAPDSLARLQDALAEISARRPDERGILVMLDEEQTAQSAIALIAAVRAGRDGRELFPDVELGRGFR